MKTLLISLAIVVLFSGVAGGEDAPGIPIDDQLFPIYKPPNDITFYKDNKLIGTLSWESGNLEFTGDAEESARLFFKHLGKGLVDIYIRENCKGDKL